MLQCNTMTKKQTGEQKVYLAYTSALLFFTEVRTGTQRGQEPKPGADAESMEGSCLLACFPWLIRPTSYRTQNHLLRNGTAHHGLGPPLLITKWENALQLDHIEAFPQLRLLPLWWLQLGSSWHIKPASTTDPCQVNTHILSYSSPGFHIKNTNNLKKSHGLYKFKHIKISVTNLF